MIKVKDTWDAIEQPVLEAETFVKGIDDGIVKGKVAMMSKADHIMDVKARTVIIRYYK
jgi:hypothetical protein